MSSRTINVLSTKVLHEGVGPKGPYTLRSVEATDQDGNPIPEALKTFADLRPGEVEVEVERQEHEQYGVSYLLKPTQRSSGGSSDVAELRVRIERLESEVKRLSSIVDVRQPGGPQQPAQQPAQPAADF
jgi:hypothetical protein